MDTDARGFPPGDLRVSYADRDRALSELSEAFQTGRITADEFDQRSGQVLGARTGKELTAPLADLPLERAPAARTTDVERAHRALLPGSPSAQPLAPSPSPPSPSPSPSP